MLNPHRFLAASVLLVALLGGTAARGTCRVLSPERDSRVLRGFEFAIVQGHGATVSWCRDATDGFFESNQPPGTYSLLVRVEANNHRFVGCPPLIELRESSPFPFMEIIGEYQPPYELGAFFGVTHERQLVIPSPPPPIINIDIGAAGYYLVCFLGEWWRSAYH